MFSAVTGRVISDVRLAREQLVNKNSELERLNFDLAKINQELDKFVYSASHDLSAPIKSIMGLINLSRLTKDPSNHFVHLNMIEESILKLQYFTSEILDFSKNKGQDVVAERFCLQDMLNEILSNIHKMLALDNLKIETELEINEIVQDRARVKIILNNLVSNAVTFRKISESSRILIKSYKFDDNVLIEVHDNGEGIKNEYRSQIFDMFFRASTNSNGSGLGLYIAREVARKIHGELLVESEYGKGSKFVLKFKEISS